ncbi:hypothetical protein [Streptomyces sp. ITFR-16]|uniref:hypothetical protein n=1 Tax=Streptomyces sp. ITFR-16 TaxID=3075198 RepID=UPI00288A79E1|nr:hypothetical protein [Streptomyces sp. ITFR-16]WNI26640.1 hypothetical protein RLT58_34270 [Streptomyces sp. ITFR-16]
MKTEGMTDGAAVARHARFGQLPERVRSEDMVEVKVAAPADGASDRYNPEGAWNHYSCLALDL